MKIGACLYSSPPSRYVGGEMMTYRLLGWAKEAGHEVIVFGKGYKQQYSYNGIPIMPGFSNNVQLRKVLFQSDVIVTHPELAHHIVNTSVRKVGIVHNLTQTTLKAIDDTAWGMLVANSPSTQKELSARGVTVDKILYPPTYGYPHLGTSGKCVVMSNMSEAKGGKLFYKLAEKMPHINFIAVAGGYGEQIIKSLPNVYNVGHGPLAVPMNLARVVISPSQSETYGMAIAEATQSGIPVIASDIPAHHDVLGSNGRYANPKDLKEWKELIEMMYDDTFYETEKQKTSAQAAILDKRTEQTKAEWLTMLDELI